MKSSHNIVLETTSFNFKNLITNLQLHTNYKVKRKLHSQQNITGTPEGPKCDLRKTKKSGRRTLVEP